MKFDRNEWTNKIKTEIGLSHVPYEKLEGYKFKLCGGFFDIGDDGYVDAKEYVDSQLEEIEEFYKFYESAQFQSSNALVPFRPIDMNGVMSQLGDVAELMDGVESMQNFDVPTNDFDGMLLEVKSQKIDQTTLKFYKVSIGGIEYVVAINDYGDIKIKDQIEHVKNTSYFVEELSPEMADYPVFQISYYQFCNLIEAQLRHQQQDVRTKILEGTDTTFEGFDKKNPLEL